MKLPERPSDINLLFNAKLVAILTQHDPMLGLIVKTFENNAEKINSFSPHFHLFLRDLHESDVLLYLGGKLLIPFTLGTAIMKTVHEAHLGQFGMKYLAQYIWWPHINGQIYRSECTKTCKNLKIVIPNSHFG